jgi:hypothetical protein
MVYNKVTPYSMYYIRITNSKNVKLIKNFFKELGYEIIFSTDIRYIIVADDIPLITSTTYATYTKSKCVIDDYGFFKIQHQYFNSILRKKKINNILSVKDRFLNILK